MPSRITNRFFSVLAALAVMIMCADVQAQLLPLRGRINAGQSTRSGLFRNFGTRMGRQYSTPVYSQPVYGQTTYGQQPIYSQPTYMQPTYAQPAVSQSTYLQPTYSQSYMQPMMAPMYEQPMYDAAIAQPYAPTIVEGANFPAYADDVTMIAPPLPVQPMIQTAPQTVESATAPVQAIPPAPATYEQTETVIPPVAEPPMIPEGAPLAVPTQESQIIDEITEPDAVESPTEQPINLIEDPATESAEEPMTDSNEEPATESTEEPATEDSGAASQEEPATEQPVEDPFSSGGN